MLEERRFKMSLGTLMASVKEAEKSGLPVLGNLIQWMIPSSTSIDRDLFQSEFMKDFNDSERGLIFPRGMTFKKSFTRAIKELSKSDPKHEYRKIPVAGADPRYGRILLKPDFSNSTFQVKNEGWISCNAENLELQSNDDEFKRSVTSAMDSRILAQDVRGMLSAWARYQKGFPTRQGGGSYFIPLTDRSVLQCENLNRLIGRFSKGYIVSLPIIGSENTYQGIRNSFRTSMLADVEKLRHSIGSFFKDNAKKQRGASEKRIQEVNDLKALASSYEYLLGDVVKEVSQDILKLEEFAKGFVDKPVDN